MQAELLLTQAHGLRVSLRIPGPILVFAVRVAIYYYVIAFLWGAFPPEDRGAACRAVRELAYGVAWRWSGCARTRHL